MQFYIMTRTHIRKFTLVHLAKCHSTIEKEGRLNDTYSFLQNNEVRRYMVKLVQLQLFGLERSLLKFNKSDALFATVVTT